MFLISYIDDVIHSMNIYLIGFRCTGKSTLGKMIAQKTGQPFVDLDAMVIKAAGKTIAALVAESGWAAFRALEKEALDEVARLKGVVVATGGGIVLDPTNVIMLRRTGRVIWLMASPDEIIKRMGGELANEEQRPSLTGSNILTEVETVLQERKALYRSAAHQVVDTEGIEIRRLAAVILNGKQ